MRSSPTQPVSLAEGEAAAEEYVRGAGAFLKDAYPEVDWRRAEVRYLDAGIMNYVYRVDVSGRRFFLKQALDRVKQHHRVGPDLAGVSPARIEAEARALRLLSTTLPPDYRAQVPAVAWHDLPNRILWTEEIGSGSVSLDHALSQGECDPSAARNLGRLLGAIHAAHLEPSIPLWPTRAEDQDNWERFLRMRTTGVLVRAGLPPAAEAAVQELFLAARRHERHGMVSHLDAAPKNALIHPDGGVALLDFELGAAVSDPAYDPGFLVGHYLLMGEVRVAMREASRAAASAVVAGYRETGPVADPEWGSRVTRYAGATLLYRLCGSSPAPQLTPECAPSVRKEGVRLLLEGEL